ncbi:calcium homeostasis endoplasmic reticulum protein isoform X2 [Nasonia vitripennis]|uniref:Calcium homeostasis endoplasmic reticulum protein n=1 Tax=Nasonia vitripennis TaxID=7425 RepID=A0A7M7PV85_NASVI|nr:calcium homeostasis endoplasmic reticulum protein isoform X2 [Nasonia vitripennis]
MIRCVVLGGDSIADGWDFEESLKSDTELRNIIDKLAQFVARNGPEFEQMTKNKQKDNPKFSFLFGGEYFNYYQYKVTTEQAILKQKGINPMQNADPRLKVSQQQQSPAVGVNNVGMAQNNGLNSVNMGPASNPPSMMGSGPPNSGHMPGPPNAGPGHLPGPHNSGPGPHIPGPQNSIGRSSGWLQNELASLQSQQTTLQDQVRQSEQNLAAQHAALMAQQQGRVEDAVRQAQENNLQSNAQTTNTDLAAFEAVLQPIIDTCTKDSISAGKAWILQHSNTLESNQVVAEHLLKRVIQETTFTHKLHIIYLVNDVLHHCARKKSLELRKAMESVVVPMFCNASLAATEEQIVKLNKLLSLWESKNNYFEEGIIEKLKNPSKSWSDYQASVMTQHANAISSIAATTKQTFDNYQAQHQAFVNHAMRQIQSIEQQKIVLDRQLKAPPPPASMNQQNVPPHGGPPPQHGGPPHGGPPPQHGGPPPPHSGIGQQHGGHSLDGPPHDRGGPLYGGSPHDGVPPFGGPPPHDGGPPYRGSHHDGGGPPYGGPPHEGGGQPYGGPPPHDGPPYGGPPPHHGGPPPHGSPPHGGMSHGDYPPHRGPPHSGSPHGGPPHGGPPHGGPPHGGPPHGGPPHGGPPHGGPPHGGPPHGGPPHGGPPHGGPPHGGPPHGGPPHGGPPHGGPPHGGPPHGGPPHGGSPYGGPPPHGGPPHGGPPLGGPMQHGGPPHGPPRELAAGMGPPHGGMPPHAGPMGHGALPPHGGGPPPHDVNFSQPPPGWNGPPGTGPGGPLGADPFTHLPLPDFSRPPPGFGPPPAPQQQPPPLMSQEICLEDLMPSMPYFELPAGLMVPLIKLEDCEYKPLDPEAIRLPPPAPPSDRLLAAVEAFYSMPNHDTPRDSDGWEKLGLYEYYRAKNEAKKKKEEQIMCGLREKSRSPSPIVRPRSKSPSPPKKRYKSKSRSRSRSRSRGRSRSKSPPPTPNHRPNNRNQNHNSRSRRRRNSNKGGQSGDQAQQPPPTPHRGNGSPDRRMDRSDRSPTPPSFLGSMYSKANQDMGLDESNKGHQLLRKMGWGGAGLGANEQGIEAPISGGEIRDRTDMYKGVGVNLNDPYENFRKSKGQAFITRMKARAEERAEERGDRD